MGRVADITRAMLEHAVVAFCQHDEELARDVVERDSDIDRLVLLVSRQFRLLLRDLMLEEGFGLSRIRFLHFREVADQVERVADHAAKISEATLALDTSVVAAAAKEIAERAEDST